MVGKLSMETRMRTVTATATIRDDHTLKMSVPGDIPPGLRSVVVVMDEPVSTLAQRTLQITPHATGPVDPACTYRREDIYGDDGR
jgi:hypothetical protein